MNKQHLIDYFCSEGYTYLDAQEKAEAIINFKARLQGHYEVIVTADGTKEIAYWTGTKWMILGSPVLLDKVLWAGNRIDL